jgi:hypothetical protein
MRSLVEHTHRLPDPPLFESQCLVVVEVLPYLAPSEEQLSKYAKNDNDANLSPSASVRTPSSFSTLT